MSLGIHKYSSETLILAWREKISDAQKTAPLITLIFLKWRNLSFFQHYKNEKGGKRCYFYSASQVFILKYPEHFLYPIDILNFGAPQSCRILLTIIRKNKCNMMHNLRSPTVFCLIKFSYLYNVPKVLCV